MAAAGLLPAWFVAPVDLAFPLLLFLFVLQEIVSAGNRRNYPIIAITALLLLLNLLYHLGTAGRVPNGDRTAIYLMTHTILLLITVIGGRVIPNFTANWMRNHGVPRVPANNTTIDRLTILATVLGTVAAKADDRLELQPEGIGFQRVADLGDDVAAVRQLLQFLQRIEYLDRVAAVLGDLLGQPVGALDGLGLDVGQVEAAPPGALPPVFDQRNLSFADATVNALTALGVLQELRVAPGPIRRIHVSRAGDFGRVLMEAADYGRDAFGQVVVASDFGHALEARLGRVEGLSRYRPARFVGSDPDGDALAVRVSGDDGELTLRTRLLVGADGSASGVRQALGIAAQEHDYGQTLLVARVRASRPPDGTAWERFTAHGPTALLPRADRHYGVVHGIPRKQAAGALEWDEAAFLARIQAAFGWRAGRFLSAGPRSAYPMTRTVASRTTAPRAVLVGNAAQSMHPVGAQGFNLGLRDALTLAELVAHGAEPVRDLEDADVVLVNTCGFIDAAKKESIDAILDAARLKDEGRCKAVFAIGCMVERHKSELTEALPEVDVFLGTSETDRIVPELVERGLIGGSLVEHPGVRLFGGDLPFVRYLKVSEGCDHGCAFCAIPLMRGKHRSFSLQDLINEAQLLEAQGAREINLVAQDLAHYGRDRRDGTGLPELLEALVVETSIPWIRTLYLYSAGISPRLLEIIGANPRIVRYLDTPMQHGADTVLARMRRPERQRTIRERLARYRTIVPDLALRTTVIVGFPGETEAEFETLLGFLEELHFDRVGCFTYSPQEGTRAYDMADDVPEAIKRERQERVEALQRSITATRYERFLGREVPLLVERVGDTPGTMLARAAWQADDIDGVVHLDVNTVGAALPGAIVTARIDEIVDDVDFSATALSVELPANVAQKTGRRSLPMAGASASTGSYGR